MCVYVSEVSSYFFKYIKCICISNKLFIVFKVTYETTFKKKKTNKKNEHIVNIVVLLRSTG